MTEELKSTLEEVRQELLIPFYKVKDIFVDYFTEERVDWDTSEISACAVDNYSNAYVISVFRALRSREIISEAIFLRAIDNECTEEDDNTVTEVLRCTLSDLTPEEKNRFLDLNNFAFPITVHFPEVTVKNEKGEHTNIKHLFARVFVRLDGTLVGNFKLLRSHYTYAHFKNNYMHSHVSNIPLGEHVSEFQGCCTGSGPINETIYELRSINSDEQWMQFCWDLDKYVTVESIAGIPYHRLVDADCEQSGSCLLSFGYSRQVWHWEEVFGYENLTKMHIDFLKYLITNNYIKFRWAHESWQVAHSFSEFALIVSKAYFRWVKEVSSYFAENDFDYNQRIESYTTPVLYTPSGMYTISNDCINIEDRIRNFSGKLIITFKGEPFYGVVEERKNTEEIKLRILDPKVLIKIHDELYLILNRFYGRNTTEICNQEE